MRNLLFWVIAFAGFALFVTSAVLSDLRRDSSAAFWLFASEQPTSSTLFRSHRILHPNFHELYSNRAQGEFISWSPDSRYYFVRFESLVTGQRPGLFRFHTLTGREEFLLPTANVPHNLQMELSPHGNAFLVTTPMYREGRGGLYILHTNGDVQFRVDKAIQVWGAEWSLDGDWIEFMSMNDGQWLNYHIKPDGTHFEESEPLYPPNLENSIRRLIISLDEGERPIIGKLGATLRNLPDDRRYFIHRWLPNKWLIAKSITVEGAASPRTEPLLYRISMDGSDVNTIFEDLLGRDPDVIDWEDDGNILYVAAQGDTNSLFQVDMVSGEVRMLIKDYQSIRSNCFSESSTTCPPVHIDSNFEWVIWRTADGGLVYNVTSIDNGETHALFQNDRSTSQEVSMISPDNRWLYVSYVDLQSRDCVTKRFSIIDGTVETRDGLCLVAISPVVDLQTHVDVWLFAGLGITGLSLLRIFVSLRKDRHHEGVYVPFTAMI